VYLAVVQVWSLAGLNVGYVWSNVTTERSALSIKRLHSLYKFVNQPDGKGAKLVGEVVAYQQLFADVTYY